MSIHINKAVFKRVLLSRIGEYRWSDTWGCCLSSTFFFLKQLATYYQVASGKALVFKFFCSHWVLKTKNQWNISEDNSNLRFISVNRHVLANAHSHIWSNFCPSVWIVRKRGVVWYGRLTYEGKWENKEVQEVRSGLYSILAETGTSVSWLDQCTLQDTGCCGIQFIFSLEQSVLSDNKWSRI